MTNSIKIDVSDVSFSYDGKTLLRHLSFKLNRGDRIVLEGESGTGKTTVFRLLLGFEEPVSGSINVRLNGNTITRKEFRSYTAWLPQDLNLGAGTVSEVIGYPFEFKSNSEKRPDRNTVDQTLKKVGLDPGLSDQPFRDLSTGQRQRVGIVICHLLDKPVLLLDEPTSALDRASIRHVAELVFSKPGRTVISTSHDPEWVSFFDKRIQLN